MHFKEKLINQTWEYGEKPNFWLGVLPVWSKLQPPNFLWWVLSLLDVKHCCKLSSYAISRKMYDPNWRKWQKNLILSLIRLPIFLKKNLAPSVTRYHDQLSYHNVQYQKKTNDPILRKFCGERTDRQFSL